jgi:LPXTG-site transpeptidase (sortase) family protein
MRYLPLFALLAALLPAATVSAQTSERCFAETGYCISGRIRQFWEQNGGLPVFGFPITPQQTETIEGKPVQVQWFERNRLELHPENAAPYDVLLGRLGAQVPVEPPGAPIAACRFFAVTSQNVCGPILAAWSASGLRLDANPAVNVEESLALFGLPLTGLRTETLADGRAYQVQWFERARFEIHPENQPPYNVLLGLLGREANPRAQAAPRAVTTVAAQPTQLSIPTVGVDARTVATGLDARRVPIVLDHDVSWYDRSAMPGQGENIVFWGHVLRFSNAPNIPAPFERLKNVSIGAALSLTDANGTVHRYRVSRVVFVKPNEVDWILPQGRELVTLVSCYGDQVINNGEVVDMTLRQITIAERVDN